MFGERNVALFLDEACGLESIVEVLFYFVQTFEDPLLFVDGSVAKLSVDLLLSGRSLLLLRIFI